jgi:hypothetical protein
MHGIKVLMAKNYIDNLSEEARKGMQEKAEQGIWPTVAPIGYRNVLGPNGKRIIDADDKAAPVVAHMFGWYASGTLSVKDLTAKVHEAELVHPRTGKHISGATIHAMLRHRIYTGEYEWRGRRYKGKHQPIITHELFDRVQGALDGRHSKKRRRARRNSPLPASCHAVTAAVLWSARSRNSVTRTIIAAALRENAASPMSAKRWWR